MDLYKAWIDWIYQLSNFELALSFILPLLVFGTVGLTIFHFAFERHFQLSLNSNDAIAFFGQCIGIAYGILVGLTAIACWDNFEEVQAIISRETSAIGGFHRLSYGLPQALGTSIRTINQRYLAEIASSDWPNHAAGRTCDTSLLSLNELREKLMDFKPESENDRIVYSKLLDLLTQMTGLRQERINQALDLAVPGVFWLVVLIGGYITLTMMFFVHMPSLTARYILMSMFSLMMGMMYFLIAVIDNPFKGEVHVSAEPYLQLRDVLNNGL